MNESMKVITYSHPESIPVGVSFLPATWMKYGAALNEIKSRYPVVFGETDANAKVEYFVPDSYHAGSFTDAWGCVWENVKEGYESIVKGHPLETREMIRTLKAPEQDIGLPHGFMFLRLMDLRGYEEMMIDFFEEPEELQMLIDIVCDYNVRQMKCIVENSDNEIIWVGDDNGMQTSLPISPALWRKYIKPAYTKIFSVAHEAGRKIFFHTDGCIYDVMPDMHEAGADLINPQIRANGLDNLVRVCKGKIPINLDLDRQMFPFAKPEQIIDHIMECTKALYLPEGGLMLSAECAADVPLENIEAIAKGLTMAASYKG